MNKSFSLKKILILITILAVPGFLYYLLQEKGKNRYRPLPVLGPKEVAATFHTRRGKKIPDTVYHQVKGFELVNQNGKTLSFPVDTQRISIVNFFFSRCSGFCQNMNREMARVVSNYQNNRLLRFFSITVDPRYDTPSVLSAYAKKFNAKAGKWDLLTGDQREIHRLAREEFLVDALADSTRSGNFIHSPLLILVDPQKRIRGFYDSTNKEQVDKLIDEVKVLIAEELRKVKDR